jgi:hypothetical protein
MEGATMDSTNEFWLSLHRLAESYQAEGVSPEERVASIVREFRQRPHLAQRELMADLVTVVSQLPDICALLADAIHNHAAERKTQKAKSAG